jgi:glutamate carboxypeptidase
MMPATQSQPLPLISFLNEQRPAMLEVLERMVRIESPSFDRDSVNRCAEYVAGVAEEQGGGVKRHRSAEYGDHLQIDFGPSKGKRLLLLGHLDTVWDIGTLERMPYRIANGRVWGPGVLDMKCGVTMMLFALRALEATGHSLRRPVTLLLNSDEEVGSETSRPVTEKLAKTAEAVLVLEPGTGLTGKLKTARKGVGDYEIRVRGKASHAGVDFTNGVSATLELARQIPRIAGFTRLVRGITVNVGVIGGGTRTNVVAEEAWAKVDIRIARRRDEAWLDRQFHSLRPFDKRTKIEVSGGLNRPPMERKPGIVALFRKAQTLGRELGMELEESMTGGGSDGNFTAALGVPTLDGLGGVGEGAHASNESILLAPLVPRTALLAKLMSRDR